MHVDFQNCRTPRCPIGWTWEHQRRSSSWVSLHMEEPTAWRLLLTAWERQQAEQRTPGRTLARLVSGLTMRSDIFHPQNMNFECWFDSLCFSFVRNKTWTCKMCGPKWILDLTFLLSQICDFISGALVELIPEQKVPYATFGSAWVGYDDPSSFSSKVTTRHFLESLSRWGSWGANGLIAGRLGNGYGDVTSRKWRPSSSGWMMMMMMMEKK